MTSYHSLITGLAQIGITEAHCLACKTPWQPEAEQLADAGLDMFDRSQKMTPETLAAWRLMVRAAATDQVVLWLVSAFRSVSYQTALIEKKLGAGRKIDDILTVNAIPGFSEHHTGRALDLATPGYEVLEQCFDQSPAFIWLDKHAQSFGFSLSYPKHNAAGIIYEPWHWAYQAKNTNA